MLVEKLCESGEGGAIRIAHTGGAVVCLNGESLGRDNLGKSLKDTCLETSTRRDS